MTTVKGGGATLHPVHAILLAFPVALFSAGLASDMAYLNTAVIQWSNFSSWLITGALVFGGLTIAWALIALVFPGRASRSRWLAFLGALLVMWIAGLVNAFQHSHDAWVSVGALGLALSVISTLFALIAAAIGYSSPSIREMVR